MFPTAGDEIYYNPEGEVLGWSNPGEPDYCDIHGIEFRGLECSVCADEDDGLVWDPIKRRYVYEDDDDQLPLFPDPFTGEYR